MRDVPRSRRTSTLHGTKVEISPAQIGRELDRSRLLTLLTQDAEVVDAPFVDVRPAILDPAARSAASTAELLLARRSRSTTAARGSVR